MEEYVTYKKMVDDRIKYLLENEYNILDIHRDILTGGKRLRPILSLIVSDVVGGDEEKALDLGICTEITQSSSLVIDDIMDGDIKRRGKNATHITQGLSKAVIGSVTLPAVAINIASKIDSRLSIDISNCWIDMITGVLSEVFDKNAKSMDTYYTIVDNKTAKLYALAAYLGCVHSGITLGAKKELRNFGLYLGRAYQIADDYTDYVKIKRGEKPMDVIMMTELLLLSSMGIDSIIRDFAIDMVTDKMALNNSIETIESKINYDVKIKFMELIDESKRNAFSCIKDIGNNDKLMAYFDFCVSSILKEVL